MYNTSLGYIRLKSSLKSNTPFLLYILTLLLSESNFENFLKHVPITLSNFNPSFHSIYISSFTLCFPPLILMVIYSHKKLVFLIFKNLRINFVLDQTYPFF